MVLTPRLSAAWQHAFGSTPTAALTFNSTGAPFTIAGVPLARDSILLEGGLDLQFNSRTTLSLVGSSQLANHVKDCSARGNLTWRF